VLFGETRTCKRLDGWNKEGKKRVPGKYEEQCCDKNAACAWFLKFSEFDSLLFGIDKYSAAIV